VIVLIPSAMLAGGFALLLRAQHRRAEGFSSITARSLIVSAVATLGFGVWAVVAVLGSSSSTASIGFLFLPSYAFAVAAVAWMTAWSLLTLVEVVRPGSRALRARSGIAAVGALLFLAVLAVGATLTWQRQSLLGAAADSETPPDRLAEILEQALVGSDYDVLQRIAANPATTRKQIKHLTTFCQDEIGVARPVRCYSILFGLASHSESPAELLTRLAVNAEPSIRTSVARNPHTPAAIAESLANDPEPSVRLSATTHPELSRQTLERLASDRDDGVRRHAAAALGRASAQLE
jgi:hypothetical protein